MNLFFSIFNKKANKEFVNEIESNHQINVWLNILLRILFVSNIAYWLCLYLQIHYLIACSISIFVYIFITKKYFNEIGLKKTLLFLGLFIFCGLTISQIWDLSFDGLAYHQNPIITALKTGYLPFFSFHHEQNPLFFDNTNSSVFWNSHYPIGIESSQLFFAQLFFNLESGKLFQFVLLVITVLHGLVLFNTFRNDFPIKLTQKHAFLISLTFILSPVILTQLFTFLIDDALHLLVCNLFFILLIWIKNQKLDTPQFLTLFYFVYNIFNSKLSGVIFIMLLFIFFIIIIILNKKIIKILIEAKKQIVVLILLITTLSFSPFFLNYVNHGHFLFPMHSNELVKSTAILNTPTDFENLSFFQKILYGYFGKTSNASAIEKNWEKDDLIKLKIPFSSDKKEWLAFYRYDIKKGGFGPFYSGFLCIFLFFIFFVLLHKKIDLKIKLYFFIFFLSLILIPWFFFPIAVVARYQATMWFIVPFSLIIFIMYIQKKWFINLFLLLIFIQTFIIIGINYGRTFLDNILVKESFNLIQTNSNIYYYSPIPNGNLSSFEYKLKNKFYTKKIETKDTSNFKLWVINPSFLYLAIPKNINENIPFSNFAQKIYSFKQNIKR